MADVSKDQILSIVLGGLCVVAVVLAGILVTLVYVKKKARSSSHYRKGGNLGRPIAMPASAKMKPGPTMRSGPAPLPGPHAAYVDAAELTHGQAPQRPALLRPQAGRSGMTSPYSTFGSIGVSQQSINFPIDGQRGKPPPYTLQQPMFWDDAGNHGTLPAIALRTARGPGISIPTGATGSMFRIDDGRRMPTKI